MQLQHLTDLHFLIDSGGKITMEIITKTEGNKATMEISGWLDTQTAPQLGEALSGLDDSITSLVFDFTNLEYISSAGLRQVIVAYKKMAQKDGFKIINVSDEVYDVFSLTGFDSKIDIQKK
jgi:anti-sigma B factor antagonist